MILDFMYHEITNESSVSLYTKYLFQEKKNMLYIVENLVLSSKCVCFVLLKVPTYLFEVPFVLK